ncbi:MAG: HAMP domain-containing histidine kinase [Micromonosporaceae bacterium]|nr:HAMP domain-containing histidine kinase [Micromonosporaceae bacterium]
MSRATIRVKLTVLYGGLFFLAGAILLTAMFLLVRQSVGARLGAKATIRIDTGSSSTTSGTVRGPAPGGAGFNQPTAILPDGRKVAPAEALAFVNQQQAAAADGILSILLIEGGIALVVVGAAAVGLGWIMSGRALRPVHEITATARRVATGAHRGLHERIALIGPRDEIKELADTFDDMLERLDRSFDGQRRFAANASHELRTPLAINRALAEVAVTRPGVSPDARTLGETLLAVNARHERLIDGLLTLADSENEITERVPVDLREVAEHVLAGTDTRDLERREAPLAPAPVLGDPVLLERLTQNLVDNAIRHNTPGGWLSVQTARSAEGCTLTVANSGPVVPPYQLETIFEPFRRLNGERHAGSDRGVGLGLSIVRAVAGAHGGEVTATPNPDGGLTVTVRLPAS